MNSDDIIKLDDIIENNWFQDGEVYVTCEEGQYLEMCYCTYKKV